MAKRNPERTAQRILSAAEQEFADKGLGGARVDAIAQRAGVNKRMLYHYFGNKDDLYLAVMERAYETIRTAERALDLGAREPVSAIRELVRFTFDYYIAHPEFMRLLNNENLHDARHIRRSRRILELHNPMIGYVRDILRRGEIAGVFRPGVDPVQLYISIAGLGYFYLSNAATLGTIFSRDLMQGAALRARVDHITEVIIGYLTNMDAAALGDSERAHGA